VTPHALEALGEPQHLHTKSNPIPSLPFYFLAIKILHNFIDKQGFLK
jgi:hypothetical protein